MGKLVDFEGYGLAEYPDDFTDAQIHDSWERNIKPILDAKKMDVLRENAAIANRNAEAANAENTIWKSTKSAVSDVGVGLMKGYVGIPEAIVGLANIPTKGYAGKWVEDAGIDFKGTKEYWDQKYSEGAKAAQAEVSQAEGFFPKGKALLDNPSALGQTIAESLPLMLGGAGLARLGLGAAKMIGPRAAAWAAGATAPVIAGAVGEGAVSAGSMAEGVRQQTEDRLLTWEQAGISLASGALTGAIGIASGKMAKRLGIDDLDTFLVSGIPAGTAKRTLTERIARGFGGVLTEGVMEEMPQSAQEQVANNLALKKPWNEGVAEAAATGLITGAVMGGAMGGLMPGGKSATPPPIPPPTTPPTTPPPLPALSNQTLATPINSWVTAPNGPHVLGQAPNAFGVGQQVVQVSQASGNFGKPGVVVSVTAPPAGGNPVVTVRFADGAQAKSDGKEFAFAEHFAQATAIKAGPLWTPPTPRPGTAPQPIPANTNQQRRTPLDATEQLQAKINAARAVGDRALVRKLSIELDMMGTPAPVVKQPLPAQRTIKPSAPIASQDQNAPQNVIQPVVPASVASTATVKSSLPVAPIVTPVVAEQPELPPLSGKSKTAYRVLIRAGFDEQTANAYGRFYASNFATEEQTSEQFRDDLLAAVRVAGFRPPKMERRYKERAEDWIGENSPETSQQIARDAIAENNRLEKEAIDKNLNLLGRLPKTVKPPTTNAPAPVQKQTAVIDADAIAENGLDQRGLYEQETPEFKQSIFNLFLKKAASIGKTDIRSLSRNYASNGLSGDNGGVSLSFYLASADGTGRTFGDNPAKGVAWEFRFGREVVPVTWGDLAEAGIATKNPDGTVRGSGFVASSKLETSKKTPNAPAPVPQQVGLPVKPEGTPPVGQAKPKAGTRNRLTSPAAGQAPAKAKPVDVAKPTPAAGTGINDRVFTEDYTGPRWTYGLRNRPMGIGAQPKGFIIGSDGPPAGRARNGTIQYPRELTKDELYSFEMDLVSGPEATAEVKQPSATEYERIEREISAALKNPLFREQSKAGADFRDAFRDLETEAEFHKPAAIAKAQAEINAEKARKSAKPQPAAEQPNLQPLSDPERMARLSAWRFVPGGGDPESLGTGFISGKHNEDIATRAGERGDIGLLITPLIPGYLKHAYKYPFVAIDNGVFSKKTPFSEVKFRKLLDQVAGDKAVKPKVLFVVAPDVVGDAAATLDRFAPWANEIHAKGLPVALAAQDGLENMMDKIPWDLVDVFFVGGSTEWKTGQMAPEQRKQWLSLFGEAHRRGIPIHMGRANTNQRISGVAQEIGAGTVDGTLLAFGPTKNLVRLEKILDNLNVKGLNLAAQDFPELGRAPTDQELYEIAVDPDQTSLDDLGAYAPAASTIKAMRVAAGIATSVKSSQQGRVVYDKSQLDLFDKPSTPIAEQPATKPKRVARGSTLLARFNAETERLGPDILSFMVDSGLRVQSKSAAKARGKEYWNQNRGDYDGALPLALPTHNIIYGGSRGPDRLAQDAFDANVIKEPTPDAFWEAVNNASRRRRAAIGNESQDEKFQNEEIAAYERWMKATEEGAIRVSADELQVGDLMDVEGEKVKVIAKDADTGEVTLKDGRKFETQKLQDGESIYVERLIQPEPPQGLDIPFGEEATQTKDDFSLAPAESVEEQKARLAAEALKGEADAAAKAKADSLTNAINKPLTGTVGDIAQDDMLDPQGGLFNNSNPLGKAPPVQPLAPLSPTDEDAARMDAIKKLLAAKLKQGPTYMGSLAPGGLDPEFFKLGTELGYLYIKSGVRKFSDFAARLINDLGEKAKPYLLSWYSNAKLTLTNIANELDSETQAQQYYQDTFGRPVQGGRVNPGAVAGSGVAGGRPGVRVARQELIPVPRKYVDAGTYSAASGFQLDEEQVRGVNLMVDRFKNVLAGAFLLADGTGFGKTAQILAVADQYRKQGLGNKILIVTKNKQIADIRFAGDAKRMGIDPKSYTITTYSGLKNIESKGWDLVLFDEAHELKNSEAAKSIAGGRLQAKHKVFATATPMDTFTGAAYFLSEITGEDETQIATKLGYKLVERTDPYSKEVFMAAVLLPESTAKTVWQNIMAYRDAAVANGSMIRREYPFFGKVEDADVSMDRVSEAEQKEIVQYYDDLIDSVSSPTAKRNYAGQKTLSLRRWSEQAKIGPAIQMALDHIAAGGKAIVVAETDKQQRFPVQVRGSKWGKDKSGIEGWLVPGAIMQMMELLEKAGIYDVSHIHDPKSNNISSEVDKFQRGPNRVALATPQSGGTGIDLDDSIGGQDRLMISLSKNLAGDAFQQLIGRVSRKNTVTPSTVRFLNLLGSFADERSKNILDKKIKTLLAIQGGSELDTAAKPDDSDITQPGQQQPPYKPSPNKPASTAPPRLDWQPYTTQKGKQKFVAKVTPEFTAWYKANGENRNSFGIFISDRDGRAWADANPNETALQSRTGLKRTDVVITGTSSIPEDELRSAIVGAIYEGGAITGLKRGGDKTGHYVVIPVSKEDLAEDPGLQPMAIGPFKDKDSADNFLEAEVGSPLAVVVKVSPSNETALQSRTSSVQAKDADYLAAVKAGDMEMAQRMVDEAAKGAGYVLKAWHGTWQNDEIFGKRGETSINKPFTEFSQSASTSTDTPIRKLGFFFGPDQGTAELYSQYSGNRKVGGEPRVIGVYLNFGNGEAKRIPFSKAQELMNYGSDQTYKTKKEAEAAAIKLRDRLERFGYKGIVFENNGTPVEYVAFSPSQIKSSDPITRDDQGNVIPLSQRFNATSEDIRESRTGSSPFYSRLNRAVEETPMQNATGFKWKGVINKWQKAKPTPTLGKSWLKGISRDEIDLVGVNDLEDGKTYSKQEVLDYLKANEVVVKDVTLGSPEKATIRRQENGMWAVVNPDGTIATSKMESEAMAQAVADVVSKDWTARKTHFSQWQLPGAKEGSYREVLLTVPTRTIPKPTSAKQNKFGDWTVMFSNGDERNVMASTDDQAKSRALRDNYGDREWSDGHSQYAQHANPIVRLRYNERTTADGKRMLFLEEVQGPSDANQAKMPKLFQFMKGQGKEIAFKYALRLASEGGYDSLGWTTGAQQADRYSLAKQLDSLKVLDASSKGRTGFDVTGYKDGKAVVVKSNVPLEQLESEIGKDLARKVSEDYAGTTGNFNKTYSGLDLEIGGEGLQKLYDVDFRNVVNGLPAVKKAGQKVGTDSVQADKVARQYRAQEWAERGKPGYVVWDADAESVVSYHATMAEAKAAKTQLQSANTQPVHSLTLTPAIRESVMGGQALFRKSGSATGLPASAVEAHIAQAYGSVPNGVIRVVERPDLNFDGQVILDAATGEFLRIEINASKLNSLDDIDRILTHEFSHIVFRDPGVQSIIGSLTDQERSQIEADMTRLGYTPDSLQEEGGARGIEQLANAWRGRNWFTQVVGRVLAWASERGLKMTRLAAELIAARAVAKVKAEVLKADQANIQQVSMGSELALQSRVVPDNAADLEIATAGQQVAAQVESIYANYEAGAQSLSQLALEKKEFRQARAELNKLTSLASARMTQLPNPAPGMTPDPMEGISVQANQVVVGPEFSNKLTSLGVAHNAADAQAKQGAIFFERVADGVTTARERLKDLEAKRNHYISIKAPAADISQVENTINSNRAQIATLEQTEHDGVTAGQRADEIATAESNKIDAEGKRDALKLAPVDDYFGGRMANLRELTEKAKASAALAKALMAGTTDPAELAKLTAEFERFDKLPETARDALVAGKMTDAQLSSVVIALQHSFVEFDLAKANMDDLLIAEQTRILKDIAQAEKDYKAALGANLDTEAVVDAALRSARGSAGLAGSVSGAARIDQLLLETAAISGMAQTLGQNIEQNRWLYDYLSGVRSTPGGILAFSKANADALGIGEDTLRKLVNVVQSSPALGSALVTLADHAAATRANNYALSLATTVPSISSLAAQAQASTVPSNAQALLNQANAAAATLASAVKPGVRAASKTAQLLSSSINQSLTQLAAVNNGASLFNQVANNPAFVAMRQNANGLNGLVINMIEPGPAKTTFLGFGTTSTVYHPELVINVDDDPAMSHRTQGHIYQWSEAAKRYVADFDLAELAHRANPATNPTPGSLGFDRAKVIGLRTALEKQVNGSFLEVSLMDEAARTSIPKVVRKLLKRSWFRQHDFVARLVGGIYGTDLRATQGRWIRGHLNARRVASRFQDLPDLQAAAMTSHGIKNIATYRSQIWNQMGGYGREFGSKLKVGFILPVSGQTITKEDMVFFKRTIDFEEQLRRFVTEVDNTRGVREKIGGQTFVRAGGSVGDYGMPRHLGRNATAFIADIISSYLNTKGFTVSSDLSAASTEAVPAFWNQRVDMLKQHLLDSTRTDRAMRQDPTMRKAEMAIANRWLSGAVDPVSSLQDLAQLLAAELATVPGINPMDYAVRHLNSELIQYHEHAVRIKAEREDVSTRNSGLSIALSSDNEFTKPAAKLELPHSLYDYGALTTGERISAQSRANHEMLVEYANALRRAIGDLKNRINRFDNNQISEAEAARSYGGGMEELRDTFEILSASLVDFEAGYKLGADPALSPSALASEIARFPVAGVLALPTVSIRNLTGGQLVVYLMERAMGYTGARLAMYNAIKNAPKALAKASYASALNIARFLDKNLLKTNKQQLEAIVDIIAKVALSPVLLALKNPTTIIAGVKSDLDQVQKLGYDTKMGFVDAFRQAWKESGLYANREEEEAALRSPTATKIGRVTLTVAKGINAFLGAVGVENSDQVLNSVNLVQSQMMETRLGEVAMKFGARLESLGMTSIDPTDKRSILLPAEWSPFLNAQASLDSLGQLRLFLEGSAASEGFQLENALLKFYQETKSGKPTHIFSAAQFEAVQRGLLAQMNTSLPTNRASVAAGNRMWRILLTLQGYPSDAFLKLINTAVGGTRNRTVAAQAASKLPLLIGIAMMAIIIGGMSDGASEYWKRKLQGNPSQNAGVLDRDFWQNKDKLMSGAGRFLAANMFYLGDVILGMQNQIQGNRGFDPASRVFPISLAQAFASSIQTTFATYQGSGDMSDVATPMVDFFAKLTPGGMEIRNLFGANRILRRSRSVTTAEGRAADMELPKQGGQRSAGPTTIVKRNLESAVGAMEEARVSGDTEAYAKAEGQARAEMAKLENYYIKRETERGKPPEEAAKAAKAAVWRDYQEINPVSSALGGRRPTASEYQTLTTGATGARAVTQQAGISAWQQGANALFNKTGTVTRETASASSGGGGGGVSGGGYGATMTASSGVGRATSGRGRMVKAGRSRLTAGRTTRSSLSRPKFRTRLRAPRNRKVSIKRVRLTA